MNRAEMENELSKVVLPSNYKIALTGNGRVANGAMEILEKLNVKKVSASDFLNQTFDHPVYTQLMCEDYNKRIDGRLASKLDFYLEPSKYESKFMEYAEKADM